MANDPRPQACPPNVIGGSPHTEQCGPYVDQKLTVRNPVQTSTAVDPRDDARAVFNQMTRVYEVDPTNHKPNNPTTPLPNSPMAWQRGRDYYANGGMVGQPFF